MGFPEPGGSCLLSCVPDGSVGYIRQFDSHRALITQQLQQMYANGQRRLGFPILYYEGGDTIALDSSTGQIYGRDKQNLQDLLQLAIDTGFEEFVCEMVPEWSAAWNNFANPTVMRSVQSIARVRQPVEYCRNFIFTTSVWECFIPLPRATHLDALAEGIPAPGQDVLLEYVQRLVSDLDDQYHDPMINISIIPTLDRVPMIDKVWGLKKPYWWNIHLYPSATEDWPTYKRAMNAAGLGGRGYAWGETYANDPSVVAAVKADPTDLFFVLGWPVGLNTPEGIAQDRLTVDYSVFANGGL